MGEPKKKSHAGLVVFIVLLIIIGLPIAFLYGFCFDSTKHDANIQPAEVGTVVQDSLFDSFKPAKTEKKLKFQLKQEQLNQVFKGIYNKFPAEARQYVKGLYVDINNDKYNFFLEAEVPLFQSRAIIETTFKDNVNETDPLQGSFTFQINDVKLARLGGVLDIVNNFAGQAVKDLGTTLQNTFANVGLHISVDMTSRVLTYTKQNLLNDALTMMGNQELVGDLLTVFFEKGLTTLNGNAGTAMSFETNLIPLHTNATYVVEEDSLALDLDEYRDNLVKLIHDKVVASSSADLPAIYQYLVRGYEGVDATVANKVQNLNLTSIGISDYTAYKGADLESGKVDIETKMKQEALLNLPTFATNHIIGSVTEADINSMLHASSIIGSGTLLAKESTTAEAVYMTFDDITAQLVDNHVYLSMAVSLNGYDVRFIIDTELNASAAELANYKIGLQIKNIFFGQYEASQKLKTTLYDYIGKAFASGDTISYQNGSFVIDFSEAIDHTTDIAIKLIGDPNVSIIGTGLGDENAKLQLGITPRI